MTIKQYCEVRGVTRQFVGEYIKKGKIPAVELPVFAEYEGERIEVGRQKFVIEELPSAEMAPRQRAQWMASQATSHSGIQTDIVRVLMAAAGGKELRQELDARYAATPDYAEYERAMAQVRKLLFDEAKYLMEAVKELRCT